MCDALNAVLASGGEIRTIGALAKWAKNKQKNPPPKRGTEGQKGAKMASIKFEPTCSACKRLIYGKIDCETFPENVRGVVIPYSTIEPQTCPYCGAFFEDIIVPIKLPYYNKERGMNKSLQFYAV